MEFYEGLEADNSKVYWTEHKAIYEDGRARPDGGPAGRPGGRVRGGADLPALPGRPLQRRQVALQDGHRRHASDVRVRAAVRRRADGRGRACTTWPPTSWSGTAGPSPTSRPDRQLEGLIGSLRKAKIDVHGTDPLKTVPKGYPKDHPRVELLRNKGLVAMKQWPAAAWLGTAAAKSRDRRRACGRPGPCAAGSTSTSAPRPMPPARAR